MTAVGVPPSMFDVRRSMFGVQVFYFNYPPEPLPVSVNARCNPSLPLVEKRGQKGDSPASHFIISLLISNSVCYIKDQTVRKRASFKTPDVARSLRQAQKTYFLIRPRNPRPLDVVRDNWLCLLSAQWYLQILSCPNNHNKGETYEQISKAITCTMALPIP